MSGEKYGDRAVAKLLAYCSAQLQTYLTAVETAQSLTAGSLTVPVAFIGSLIANDPRTPVLMVDCTDGSAEDWGNGLHSYGCAIVLKFAGDADVAAGETKARRYMTALIDMIRANATLGGTVDLAWGGEQQFDAEKEGDAMTMHAVALEVSVRIHEPT